MSRKFILFVILLCFYKPVLADIREKLEELSKLKEELRQERIERVNDKIANYNKLKSLEMKIYSLEDKLMELKTEKFKIEEELDNLKSEKEKIKEECSELEEKEKEVRDFLMEKIDEMKEKIENLPPFHKKERLKKLSSIKDIPGFFEFLKKEVLLGESSEVYSGNISGRDVKILKIGGIFSVYKSREGEVAILEKRIKGDRAVYSWNKNIKSSLKKDLCNIFQTLEKGGERILKIPVDVTQGTKLRKEKEKMGFLGWFVKGGPVMIPLTLVALTIIIMAIERLLFFRREYINADKLMEEVLKLESDHKKDEAIKLCEMTPGPVARMLRVGLREHHKGRKIVEEMLHEQHLEEIPRLTKNLSTIAVLAGIAPLLGLLGTVSGMITTFHIITYHGGGDPRLLAGGISEALITTEFGLIIAIPALLLHNHLSNKAEKIAEDLEKNAVKLINSLPDV